MLQLLFISLMSCCFALAAQDINLAEAVGQAIKSGQKELKLSPQIYRVPQPVVINRASGFTLEGNGATLIFGANQGNSRAIQVSDSSDIVLKNFTVDYDPLPFTQGRVNAVSTERRELTIALDAGYPELFRKTGLNLQIYDPRSRLLKDNGGDLFNSNVVSEALPRTYTLRFGRPVDFIAVGDLVAIDWRISGGISFDNVHNALMEDVTILTSPNAAIMGRFVSGDHILRRIVIKRGDRLPEGATAPRLVSSVADGINYAILEKGVTIEDCDVSFQGDDAVNFHGASLSIVKQESPTTFTAICHHDSRRLPQVLSADTPVRFMTDDNYGVFADAKLKSLAVIEDQKMPYEEFCKRFPRATSPDAQRTCFRLEIDRPVTLPEGLASVDFPAGNGGNFVIRNNYFHDNRAFALRLMAGNGVVENNRFERQLKAAIAIGPEYQPWREAGWVDNLVIRNNTFSNQCMESRSLQPDSGAVAAIMVRAGVPEGNRERYPGNRNLVIENNRIADSRAGAVYIDNTDGATVRDNQLQNVLTGNTDQAGKNSGWRVTGPVTVAPGCKNVTVKP